ncbi:hypothetical protein J3R82DRAFT_1827 [Butyriboletus roseoflavus]|nr:hypothetical protein J3R82DRAFT_1827 [Butyriboletus roseoflavus]
MTMIRLCKFTRTDFSQLTDQFEGNLIRVFRRLGELLRQMTQAAKVIGNSELQEKFQKASEMLERPNSVIFCVRSLVRFKCSSSRPLIGAVGIRVSKIISQ